MRHANAVERWELRQRSATLTYSRCTPELEPAEPRPSDANLQALAERLDDLREQVARIDDELKPAAELVSKCFAFVARLTGRTTPRDEWLTLSSMAAAG